MSILHLAGLQMFFFFSFYNPRSSKSMERRAPYCCSPKTQDNTSGGETDAALLCIWYTHATVPVVQKWTSSARQDH